MNSKKRSSTGVHELDRAASKIGDENEQPEAEVDEEEDIRITLKKTLNKIENCEDDLQNVNLEIMKLENLLHQIYTENV